MLDLETLSTVFAFATVQEIIVADELLTRSELAYYATLDRKLRKIGLLDSDGTMNVRYREALAEADRRLGTELSREAKLELVGLFHRASKADQDVDVREGEIIQRATERLGLERQEVLDYLTSQYVG